MNFLPTSFFRFGIRQKLLLVLSLVLLTTLTVSSWLTLNEEKQRILEEIDNRGSDISRFVSKSLTFSVVGYDYHTIDLLLKEITLTKEVDYAKVTNTKGKVLSQSGTHVNDPQRMQLFVENIMLNSEKLGELTLGINTSSAYKHIQAQRFRFLQRELFITLIIILGEFFALSYLIIRPVSIISESLTITGENKTVREIPLSSNDEFGQLAQQFNKLNKELTAANLELQTRVDFADKQLRKNIKDLKAQKNKLSEMNKSFLMLSITDALTGLYNRRYFEEHLETEKNLSQRHSDEISLILMDIDHFKNINDTHGHVNGDKVLKKVAKILKHRVRKTDIACRIGGEEFVVICKQTDKQAALKLAEKLRNSIQELVVPIGQDKVSVTISIGVANLNQKNFSSHANHLYRFADLALYFSKENGRNAVTHYDEIEKRQNPEYNLH